MTTGKKTHWLRNTLIVLVICGIAGVVWAAVSFSANPGRTCASANLQFSYNGSGEGKAPNGYPFSVNGIRSDEVIAAALEASALADQYTVDQIRDNLAVTGVYPENIVRQMTAYTSLLDADADQQAAMTDYHPTLFNVRLYNDFDPHIVSGQLTGLLNNLLEAYRAYFAKNNSAGFAEIELIPDLSEYDYAHQLTAIRESAAQQQRFAKEMAEKAPAFQQERKGFTDILTNYESLESDIDRLSASVSMNSLSKDRERLRKQYEMIIRTLGYQMESEQEELKQIEKLVNAYDKDSILYVSTSSAVQKVDSNSSATYDKLVARKKELTDALAASKADVAKYEALLADMAAPAETGEKADETAEETAKQAEEETAENTGAAAELTEEEQAQLGALAGEQIRALQAKKDAVTAEFIAMLDAYTAQEVNERTVSVSGLRYSAPKILSGAFAIQAIKTAGALCALGFIVCLVLLIASRWKEDRRQKA